MAKREWLKAVHPLYALRQEEWERNERRYRGGTSVAVELRRFDWETLYVGVMAEQETMLAMREERDLDGSRRHTFLAGAPGEHYRARQSQAVYLNFPEQFMGMLKGHLFRKRPMPPDGLKFGTLGEVRRVRDSSAPTNAEIIYYNVDGIGNDGSQWDAWWADVTGWSGVTGHRWLFAEATPTGATTKADVLTGKRPYLCHLSPLEVPNWDYCNGKLSWAMMKLPGREAYIKDGKLCRDNDGPVRLYVAQGYTGLLDDGGLDFSLGGWWTFDTDGEQTTAPGDTGTWDMVGGEIPMWPHFYQRDKDQMSRPGVTEIGNAAVSYMNLDSAATYDAWDSASSLQFMMGVDPEAFRIATTKIQEGSKFIPVPLVKTDLGGGSSVVPTIVDSAAGAVPATIFTGRMAAIRDSVMEITGQEAANARDTAGIARRAGFSDNRSPRLALMASEVETSQNIAIFFLEKRFGSAAPSGAVAWTRDFDLEPLLDSIQRLFAIEADSGIRSKTLGARAMVMAGKETGLVVDDQDEAAIRAEYEASADAQNRITLQQAGASSEFGRGGTNNEPPAAPADQVIQTTPATVLQGAQIAGALAIVVACSAGTIPRDAAIAMLETMFNLSNDAAVAMVGADANFKAPPAPTPFAPALAPGDVVPPAPKPPVIPPLNPDPLKPGA